MIQEPPLELLDKIIRIGWDWNSFRGCVLRKGKAAAALAKLRRSAHPHQEIVMLTEALVSFQDWADACAMLIRSKPLSVSEIQRRVALAAVNRRLAHVRPANRAGNAEP